MSHLSKFTSISATAIFFAMPAYAEVSAAQVWGAWQEFIGNSGMTTSVGTATESGGTITVTDFTASLKFPDGAYTQTIPEIKFQSLGNGTVAITMSPEYPIIFSADQGKDTAVEIKMLVQTDALTAIASGSAETTQYDITAGAIKVLMDEIMAEGDKIPMDVEVAFQDITGQYVTELGELRQIRQKFDARQAIFGVNLEVPESGDKMVASGIIKDISSQSVMNLLTSGMGSDLAAALRDGMSMDGAFEHGEMTFSFDIDADGEQAVIDGLAGAGSAAFKMGADGLGYSAGTDDFAMTMSGSEIPFPKIDVSLAQYSTDFFMPVMKSEEPSEFRLAMNIKDLTVNDEIWNAFDPMAQLPRDPATIGFSMEGTARLFLDIFDPEQTEGRGDDAPGEINSVSLSDLVVSVLGAKLTGMGAFTFDNSDLTTFDGMPAPTGSVDLTLVGANGLIDKLVAMGFVPDDQAMGARMMLGLFARPADGPDTLKSKIEVNGDGSISANGQRLR